MNVPNILTIFRMLLIPIVALSFYFGFPIVYPIVIFLIAGLTDILDGYIARKYDLITKWGIVMDPLADKLMSMTMLCCLVLKNYIPFWVFFIVAVKELFMISSGVLLYKRGTVIPSDRFGKISTLLFYISIFALAFNTEIGNNLLYVAVASSIVALANYAIIYYKSNLKV